MVTLWLSLAWGTEAACFEAPTRACLIEEIRASPWADKKPLKRTTVAIRALLVALSDDAAAAEALATEVNGMFSDRDFAQYDLVTVYARFGKREWAAGPLEQLAPQSALHWQAKLTLDEADPDAAMATLKQVPEELGFRSHVLVQALWIQLDHDRLDAAKQIVALLPEPTGQKSPVMHTIDQDGGRARIARWAFRKGDLAEARAQRDAMSDPSEVDAWLQWADADESKLQTAIAAVPEASFDKNWELSALAEDLVAARRYAWVERVQAAMVIEPHNDPRKKSAKAHLLELARHDWNATVERWDAYPKAVRSDAVWPLLLVALESPTPDRVAFGRRLLLDAPSFSLGHQKELALAELAAQL